MKTTLWLYCAVFSVFLWAEAEGTCYTKTDCASCTNHNAYYMFSCNWCPLSKLCHMYGSWYNYCDEHIYISEEAQCTVPETGKSQPYNHTLAGQLAHWAALAYAKPKKIDSTKLSAVVNKNMPGQYRVLKYLQRQCDEIMNNSASCSLLIAVSDSEKDIIVSFEGTENMEQLANQLLSAMLQGQQNTSMGGSVMAYNQYVHDLLYPCLKAYLQKLLVAKPGYSLTVTGHSLGGAQAQLAAATLVHDGVIATNKLAVYTFGSPRFGNTDFAAIFDRLVKTNWRLVQAGDPVPKIPISYYYYHTHGEVWFQEPTVNLNSNFIICSMNEDKNCALSQDLCLEESCIRIHKSYFIKDMGYAYGKKNVGGPQKPKKSKYGGCFSFDF